ncbi:MerR family transcriptional regulator [Candidatus Dependentiae bacterium]|nr:MAG: MerR family transcriptional regulator [Candidatus Dependentiae bacterium]
MKMQKKQFRIGELANKVGVEKFVIRFWEKEFNITTNRSTGRQRFYTESDLETFECIKDLLYNKGFTIAGAKKQLKAGINSESPIIASQKTTMDERSYPKELIKHYLLIQKQLTKLRELL